MKPELAANAASAETDTPVEQVQRVVTAYLRALALCPVCYGAKTLPLLRGLYVTQDGAKVAPRVSGRDLGAGERLLCPHCGSVKDDESGVGDPEWVTWCCVAGGYAKCVDAASRPGANGGNHAACGWRVTVPLDAIPEAAR